MQRTLEALANDALQVEMDVKKRSKEHQEAGNLSIELEQRLEEQLTSSNKKLLEELMEAVAIESSYYAQERFIHGYRLGALMTTEVFMDCDQYWGKGLDRV